LICTATVAPDDEQSAKTMMDTLEELEWCLEQLETIQTHKSVSDMATSKVSGAGLTKRRACLFDASVWAQDCDPCFFSPSLSLV